MRSVPTFLSGFRAARVLLAAGAVCCLTPWAGPRPAAGQEAPGKNFSALVVFAKFAGESAGDSAPAWAADLFDPSLPGSFTHFYNEMSRGRLRVDGRVLPRRYASSQPASAQGAVPARHPDASADEGQHDHAEERNGDHQAQEMVGEQ